MLDLGLGLVLLSLASFGSGHDRGNALHQGRENSLTTAMTVVPELCFVLDVALVVTLDMTLALSVTLHGDQEVAFALTLILTVTHAVTATFALTLMPVVAHKHGLSIGADFRHCSKNLSGLVLGFKYSPSPEPGAVPQP